METRHSSTHTVVIEHVECDEKIQRMVTGKTLPDEGVLERNTNPEIIEMEHAVIEAANALGIASAHLETRNRILDALIQKG